ncbi:MAG: glyoxalase [Cyanobacteria bacterium P01_H01_bin.15]
MEIRSITGFAVITKHPDASVALYKKTLALPLKTQDGYNYMDKFSGANHFGVWPLKMAAQSCFGQDKWPESVPIPTATIEFELSDSQALESAVREMKTKGQDFIHESRAEPWGQMVARFISPEGLLIGLTYTPGFGE